ncbi:MAG: hypothetical protein ACXAC2_03470, partial [Candidatus Kariarchaeaceae archaeon]
NIKPQFTLPSTRIISGKVSKDGTGQLDPSFTRIGTIQKLHGINQGSTPSFFLEVSFSNQTTNSYEFEPNFSDHYDIDHPQEDTFPFSFWIPDNGQITKVELYDNARNLLDMRESTGFTIDPTTPASFDIPLQINRNEKNSIQWTYNSLVNSSTIYSQLQYSPDGALWFNLGRKTTGTSTGENFLLNSLPGGSEAQFRLILTDGFDTVYAVGGQKVSVPLLAPEIKINKNSNLFTGEGKTLGLDQITSLADPRPSPIGSLISLKATGFDPQYGKMDTSGLSWTVSEVNENGLSLSQSSSLVDGETFRFRFNKPGLYKIEVSGTSNSGLTNTDSILIRVLPAASVDSAKFEEYKLALNDIREGTTSDTTASSSSTDETKKSDKAGLPVSSLILFIPFIISGIIRNVNRKKRS